MKGTLVIRQRFVRALACAMTSTVLISGCGGSRETSSGTAEQPKATESKIVNNAKTYSDQTAAECVECEYSYDTEGGVEEYNNTEGYTKLENNDFFDVTKNPLSTFAADVDTASYANVRRMINDGVSLATINKDAVRAEEFINYFHYDLDDPSGNNKFGVTTEVAACPWNDKHQLMFVGVTTKKLKASEMPHSNLVFLIDVSGSMMDDDKLPLLKKSFGKLVDNLTEDDRISIVTYSGEEKIVLNGANGGEKEKIQKAINSLEADGCTNGEAGIKMAYEVAKDNFIKGGNNRVIMATDGDLNVGISDEEELKKFITNKKDSGVFLSVLGFGTGNVKDNNMEALADYGNGNYSYIDSTMEAKKVFVEEMSATLVTIAKDVKLQIEFNPENVKSYRQIGYENRQMSAEDFKDDKKDGGEIGAGHQVIALYEIVPQGVEDEKTSDSPDLKYQKKDEESSRTSKDASKQDEEKDNANSNTSSKEEKNDQVMKNAAIDNEVKYARELATIRIRYKEPDKDTSVQEEKVVSKDNITNSPSKNFLFASYVAEFAQLLEGNKYASDLSCEKIYNNIKELNISDDEYKAELMFLVKKLCD